MDFNRIHWSPGRGGHTESSSHSKREPLLKAPGKNHAERVGHGFSEADLSLGLSPLCLCPCKIIRRAPSHSPECASDFAHDTVLKMLQCSDTDCR